MNEVTLELDRHVATITLSRPERLNTLTESMLDEIIDVLDHCDADDNVRCVILTGSGRAFCAGADLSLGPDTFEQWLRGDAETEGDLHAVGARRDSAGRLSLKIYESLKPVIVAINGAAIGAGITVTLPADIRLASDQGKIGFVFTERGMVPESCSSWFLPKIVGMSTAQEWLLTARIFDANEAYRKGLVHAVHPADRLLDEAYAIAERISSRAAPVSASLSRRMLWRSWEMQHPMQAHEIETHAINARGVSDDVKEGVTAFLEKRQPHFPNRVNTDLPDIFATLATPEYVAPDLRSGATEP